MLIVLLCRDEYQRTISGISTSILQACYPQEQPIYLVGLFECLLRDNFYVDFGAFTDKGVAKVARQLGFDYAEAVVRGHSATLTVCQ